MKNDDYYHYSIIIDQINDGIPMNQSIWQFLFLLSLSRKPQFVKFVFFFLLRKTDWFNFFFDQKNEEFKLKEQKTYAKDLIEFFSFCCFCLVFSCWWKKFLEIVDLKTITHNSVSCNEVTTIMMISSIFFCFKEKICPNKNCHDMDNLMDRWHHHHHRCWWCIE